MFCVKLEFIGDVINMFKIVLDYSYLHALLCIHDKNREIANDYIIFSERLYIIPFHIFCNVMKLCEDESVDVKREIHYYLDKCTRIQLFIRSKYPYDDIDKYITADVGLSFDDFITLEFMKQKVIRTIVSFNQAFDIVGGINRVYDLDEYNSRRLNFFKYEWS